MLTVPELETVAHTDGTITVQTLVKRGPLDPAQRRAAAVGARVARRARRSRAEVRDRDHAAAPRARRDPHAPSRPGRTGSSAATHYDVLEITPLAEYPRSRARTGSSARATRRRCSRATTSPSSPRSSSRPGSSSRRRASTLVDDAERGRYTDWVRANLAQLETVWAIDPSVREARRRCVHARPARARRGRRAPRDERPREGMPPPPRSSRVRGEPRVGALPRAGRSRQGSREAAIAERRAVEELPRRPPAVAARARRARPALRRRGDADSARWHLHTALSFDPKLPAAVALAQRLG